MSAPSVSTFAELLMRAPAGVALLARLEVAQRDDVAWFEWPSNSNSDAVQLAAASVKNMTLGELLAVAVSAAEHFAGPWSGESLSDLPTLYEAADSRHEIAEAVTTVFFAPLHRGADLRAQEWWYEEPRDASPRRSPYFTDYSEVYGNGEFTWSGLWTATDPPDGVHDALISAWDGSGRDVSRWLLPIRANRRLWTIDGPDDWVRLVETYPKMATRPHAGWELPGPNQHRSDIRALLRIPRQHAVRDKIQSHLLPDWNEVAVDFDGVHLSWAGFLTAEGYVSDLPSGGVTMLRYWGSERTLWLHDVFGEPRPLTAPTLTSRIGGHGVDVSVDGTRRARDLGALDILLGRKMTKA